MTADTLEYLAEMLRKTDAATQGFQLDGVVEVWDSGDLLGHVVFNGDTESEFEVAPS